MREPAILHIIDVKRAALACCAESVRAGLCPACTEDLPEKTSQPSAPVNHTKIGRGTRAASRHQAKPAASVKLVKRGKKPTKVARKAKTARRAEPVPKGVTSAAPLATASVPRVVGSVSRGKKDEEVLRLITAGGGLTASELATRLGVHLSSVWMRLQRMVAEGVLTCGATKKYHRVVDPDAVERVN